jgi:hypothetical protein
MDQKIMQHIFHDLKENDSIKYAEKMFFVL